MATFTESATFEVVNCANCGMPFGLTDDCIARLRRNGESFYCPRGHRMSYGKSDEDKLRSQLKSRELALATAKRREETLENERDHTEHRRRGEKAAKTRLRNKIAKGLCPCCGKEFKNLHRHMENQHPDFTSAAEVK